ncbi:MAG TPA: hypothetical protein VFD31_05835 [Thermoleophilaceae bacterium]|nr:hypothetical protein [Thermoleophilaceae bacterium]
MAGTFMWMDESALPDGSRVHAYKHIYTRRYLYLTEAGCAYEWTACQRFVRSRLDYALEAALCNWWVLAGWDAEDAEAVRMAILKANRAATSQS